MINTAFAAAMVAATVAASPADDIRHRWEAWRTEQAVAPCATDSDCVASLILFGLDDYYVSDDLAGLLEKCRAGEVMACHYRAALWPDRPHASK